MSLERDIDLLGDVALFSVFTADQRRMLAFGAESRQLKAGETLFTAGESADSGFVVISGQVGVATDKSTLEDPANRFGRGSLLGEMALITPTSRPSHAVALTDVQLIEIRRGMVRRMLDEYPDLARQIWERLADRLSGTAGSLMTLREQFSSEE